MGRRVIRDYSTKAVNELIERTESRLNQGMFNLIEVHYLIDTIKHYHKVYSDLLEETQGKDF